VEFASEIITITLVSAIVIFSSIVGQVPSIKCEFTEDMLSFTIQWNESFGHQPFCLMVKL